MTYTADMEPFTETYDEIEPLYRAHYAEMSERLAGLGRTCSPYNPRLDEYIKASKAGYLLTFILRCDGEAVGYTNIYVTNDMHNGDYIATEDTIFVRKDHRNGVGKRLAKFVIEFLRGCGVKRFTVSAMTDVRATKLWARMGFKELATQMVYNFEDSHVR